MKYTSTRFLVSAFLLAAPFLLFGCGAGDWLGEKEDPPLPGERISLQTAKTTIVADAGLENEQIILPPMPVNAAWPQALGNAAGVSGNLAFSEHPQLVNTISVGEGTAFSSPLVPAPIVADGMVFAMDGAGVISAHHADHPDKVYWTSLALTDEGEEDEPALLGGGLAWANNTLFAANDEGRIVALNATDGSQRWVKELKLPLRSPPRIAGKWILLLTADNQLLTLVQSTGEMNWSHRGINEIAGQLHAVPPAVRDTTVLTSYSSGEVVALDLASGNPLWSDNLAGGGPGSFDPATFSTVSPIMAKGLSFTGSSSLLAAFESDNGRRLWDRKVPAFCAPWLAGNYLFLLMPDHNIAAIRGMDGAIPWITSLPEAEDDSQPALWFGPVVAEGRLWIAGNHGKLVSISAQTPNDQEIIEIPDEVMTTPVIANRTMYLLDKEARLHLLK